MIGAAGQNKYKHGKWHLPLHGFLRNLDIFLRDSKQKV